MERVLCEAPCYTKALYIIEGMRKCVLDSSCQAHTNLDQSQTNLTGTVYMLLEDYQRKHMLTPLLFLHLTVCLGRNLVTTGEMIWLVSFLRSVKFMLIHHISICWASRGSTWLLTEAPHPRCCVVLCSFPSTTIYALFDKKLISLAPKLFSVCCFDVKI